MATQTATLPPGNIFASKPTLTAPAPSKPPIERIRPYKDFLTPALHRSFTRAAFSILAGCYIESFLISPPSLLWFWNPISTTGMRALLLFLPCLAVFIVRVANMHIGALTTSSAADTVGQYVTSRAGRTAHTVGWYVFSAWFFGELYIWSQGSEANLGWVDQGRYDERPRLNENPIFLRSFYICLAIAQAALHLSRGEDQLPIREKHESTNRQSDATSKLPQSLLELYERLPSTGHRVAIFAIPGLAFTLPIYFLLIRPLVWPYFYTIGSAFFRQLPAQSRPTGLSHLTLLGRQAIWSACLLILLWELSNAIFTTFVSRPPLKRDQPLTSELKDANGNVFSRSKDPNGSLINGLKSRKEVTKTFAFWELWIICSQPSVRRKTTYTEVDRAGGSTWSQISQLCLSELTAITNRIKLAQAPAEHQKTTSAAELQRKQQGYLIAQQQQQSLSLPKIADRGVQDGDVWATSKPDFAHSVGNMARSIGQSPNAPNPFVPRARKAIEWGADRMLSREEQQRMSREGLAKEASGTLVNFLRTPVGEPFRKTFGRRVCAVVFGTPHSEKINIIHASKSLSTLCAKSLEEDDYGQVAKSVALILRTYTSTITAVNIFVAGFAPSWTDVYFTERDRRVGEVEELVDVLRQGLEEVLLAFGEYAGAVGVSKKELREARELVGKLEMRQVG